VTHFGKKKGMAKKSCCVEIRAWGMGAIAAILLTAALPDGLVAAEGGPAKRNVVLFVVDD